MRRVPHTFGRIEAAEANTEKHLQCGHPLCNRRLYGNALGVGGQFLDDLLYIDQRCRRSDYVFAWQPEEGG